MKKHLITTTLFILLSIATYAQNETRYCDLKVYQPGFKNYFADINYGGNSKEVFKSLADTAGKKIRFPSELDALNYMVSQGWQLTTCYRHGNEIHFFLKK